MLLRESFEEDVYYYKMVILNENYQGRICSASDFTYNSVPCGSHPNKYVGRQ